MVAQSKNQAWLSKVKEDVLEPDLPICDPHHHLWDFRKGALQARYLLDEILDDVGGGHNIVSTVFIECGAMFKADGPEACRCVGETEFVNGIAAMSASGIYGKTRIAAGIVGTVDLRMGDAAAGVLDAQIAAGGGRFRGIRRGAFWHAEPRHARTTAPTRPRACSCATTSAPASSTSAPRKLSFEVWCTTPRSPTPPPGARIPGHHDHPRPFRRPDRHRPLRGQAGGGLRRLEDATSTSWRAARTWWPSSAASTWRSTATAGRTGRAPPTSTELADATRPLLRVHHRAVRRRTAACSSRTSRSTR